jgi:hypothetical protein
LSRCDNGVLPVYNRQVRPTMLEIQGCPDWRPLPVGNWQHIGICQAATTRPREPGFSFAPWREAFHHARTPRRKEQKKRRNEFHCGAQEARC